MSEIVVVGYDPSFRNWGMVRGIVSLDPIELVRIEKTRVVVTKKESGKKIRVSSDDLRCARILQEETRREATSDVACVMSEIPFGSKSARSCYGFGIVCGVLAGSPVPVVEVTPTEVKRATVGRKGASKEDIIDWAVEKFPEIKWPLYRGEISYPKSEHIADAIGAIEAGIRTEQFKQIASIVRSVQAAA